MVTTLGKNELGGLEVVVVAVHTHRGEPVDLILVQHAQRAGDVDLHLVADRLDARRDLAQQPLVGTAHRGDDAELGRAGLRGLLRRLHQAGDVEPRAAHRGGEQAGLRTEVAVLGAPAGLEADDALDLDLGAAPAHPDLVGQRQQFLEPVVGQLQHGQNLVLVESLTPSQHLLTGEAQYVHCSGLRHRWESPPGGPGLERCSG